MKKKELKERIIYLIRKNNSLTCIKPMNNNRKIDKRIYWILTLPIIDKVSENSRNIYEWDQINQTILEIDFDWTLRNELGRLTFCRFGISKYYYYSKVSITFKCYWTRITETISFWIDNGC